VEVPVLIDNSPNKQQTYLTDIDLNEESAISSEKCVYIAIQIIQDTRKDIYREHEAPKDEDGRVMQLLNRCRR
jgi:hypothetical protein